MEVEQVEVSVRPGQVSDPWVGRERPYVRVPGVLEGSVLEGGGMGLLLLPSSVLAFSEPVLLLEQR